MNKSYIVALDQGTTSSRAVVFNRSGDVIAKAAFEFTQHYPQPGWVEHEPRDILSTQVEALRAAIRQADIRPDEIIAIGITNQRETTLMWDRVTGECVHRAIVWQCRRTAGLVDQLVQAGHRDAIRQKTGLVPDAYFSGTKLQWLLQDDKVRQRAERGELCFGTVDSFLAWHLVKGHPHVTDATNASRTMLFNIHSQTWDDELLDMMSIPHKVLPRVIDTAAIVGMLDESILGASIPVAALVGDQHAALFGQGCFDSGMAKNTYGTGCFMLMTLGQEAVLSEHGLLTTMAWRLNGQATYALEGSVFMGGATVQWLRDELKLIKSAAETEALALSVPDNGGVCLVPAFTGLGAPHWQMYARGTLLGLTRGSSRAHIVRAALESIALQSMDLFDAMVKDANVTPSEWRVDGGASANGFLMQFQADMIGRVIRRPEVLETTALGAALLAGLATGVYASLDEVRNVWREGARFDPAMSEDKRKAARSAWQQAMATTLYDAKGRGPHA